MFRRRRKADDFREEIAAHIELESARLGEQGLSAEEARAVAHRRFGNIAQAEERFYEAGRWAWWDRFRQDVHYALRILRKAPAFSITAVLTMALAIGATTAIFSVVDATLLRPLPYPHPQELVRIAADLPGTGTFDVGLSEPEWQDLEHSGIFEHVSPDWFDDNNLTGTAVPLRVSLSSVAPNYFAILGVKPRIGRTFDVNNHGPGYTLEVVISDGLWKRAFGSDPHILERSIRMDTDVYRIIGVMPPEFRPPGRTPKERGIEVWAACNFYGAPLTDHPPRNIRNLPTAIARIQPGLTVEEAQRRVDGLTASIQKQFAADYPRHGAWKIRLVPLKETVVGNVRQPLMLLMGAVGLVLIIACVNVANLLLARSSARQREMAVRRALGAARTRLVSQLLTESLVLSVLGGIVGVMVLVATKRYLLRLVPDSLPRLTDVSINWNVLLFAVAASILAGVIFGIAPAFHASRSDLAVTLKQAMRATASKGQAQTRRVLVIAEFAVSLVIIVAASLLLRSFRDLLNVQLGFNPRSVMAVRTRLPYPNIAANDRYKNATEQAPFFREVLRRVRMLPGVEEAAIGNNTAVPLDHPERDQNLMRFVFEQKNREGYSLLNTAVVSPEYFHLLGMSLERGRVFTERDDENAPQVAVVNEAMAKLYWPGEDAIGKHFRRDRPQQPWITVVGVVADTRSESLEQTRVPEIYVSVYQAGSKHLAIFVRGELDTSALPEQVRKAVQGIDDTLPVFGAETLKETVSDSLAQRRFAMEMVGAFALTALLLTAIGIYGVMSSLVNERAREMGIRMALGARRLQIMKMILRDGVRLATIGAAAGIAGAMVVSELMSGVLYGVRPTDPLTFSAAVVLLLGVAMAACFLPARRAVRTDPMMALRYE